jgi:hypothetical protein
MPQDDESLTPAQRAKLMEELKQRLKEIEELKAALRLNTPEGMPAPLQEEAQAPTAQKAREAVEELRVPPLEMLVDRPDFKKKKQPELST